MKYNPDFLQARRLLSDDDKSILQELSKRFSLEKFKRDHRTYDETCIDFVYTSAKIEGNTYDRIDTDNLIKLGLTAGQKKYSDAVMIVNLRNAFENVMCIDSLSKIDLDFTCDLHKVLMKDLLPISEQGIVRTGSVTIGASEYEPLSDTNRLRTEMKFLFSEAQKFDNAFETAIYLHCNLAYLQYFRDGNKRCARLMQTAALTKANILPLFFSDTLIDRYQRAIVKYYETGEYGDYVSFFKDNYELATSKVAGSNFTALENSEKAEFQKRIEGLARLESGSVIEREFSALIKLSIAGKADPQNLNWAEIDRNAIVFLISERGFKAADVGEIIVSRSPGASCAEKQSAILEDIQRIGSALKNEFTTKRTNSADDETNEDSSHRP